MQSWPARPDAQSASNAASARANDAVTTVTGKEGTREAAASCLVFSPFILEAEGGDGSTEEALKLSQTLNKVCCIKF